MSTFKVGELNLAVRESALLVLGSTSTGEIRKVSACDADPVDLEMLAEIAARYSNEWDVSRVTFLRAEADFTIG